MKPQCHHLHSFSFCNRNENHHDNQVNFYHWGTNSGSVKNERQKNLSGNSPDDVKNNADSKTRKQTASRSEKKWVAPRPSKRGRDEVAVTGIEILHQNNDTNSRVADFLRKTQKKPTSW